MGKYVRLYQRFRVRIARRTISRCVNAFGSSADALAGVKRGAFDVLLLSSCPLFALTRGGDEAAYGYASLLTLIASVVDGRERGDLICERA